jgi:gliding motility-associated-like protein
MKKQNLLHRFTIFLFLFSFLQQDTLAQLKGPFDEYLSLSQPAGREVLLLEKERTLIELCELEVGKEYQFSIFPADHTRKLNLGLQFESQKPQNSSSNLSFVPKESCETLTVFATAGFPLQREAVYLSWSVETRDEPKALPEFAPAISTDASPSVQFLIEEVFVGGDCYEVTGVTSSGNSQSHGTFTNGGTSINIDDGVIISTGNIANATGPNNATGESTNFPPPNGYDPDLDAITAGSLNDVSIIEFEFTPSNDTVLFEYVFASEEYCDYTGSIFNDVFGFFISGPGINGPYTNNAENIAIIPGTTTAVAINNVNHITNPAYYVGNIPAGSGQLNDPDCNGHPTTGPPSTDDCQFDAYTVVLTALAVVIPCSTYHIKLAIADVGDGIFDSAVFLKANSFNSGGLAKAEPFGTIEGSNVIYEGCLGGYFEFSRQGGDNSEDLVVNFTISSSSTATPGTDYTPLPTSITIPAGQDTYQLFIDAFNDLITEGPETIILEMDVPCLCSNPTVEIIIDDPPDIEMELSDQDLCSSQSVTLSPNPTGGVPEFTYNWSTGDTDPQITVMPAPPGETYYVTVTDDCGNTAVDTATINILEAPTADISGSGSICAGGSGTIDLTINFTGSSPWTFVYIVDGVEQAPITTSSNPYTLTVDATGSYSLGSVSNANAGCEGTVSGSVEVTETLISAAPTATPVSCNGGSDGSITLTVGGGTEPYSFQWDNGAGNSQNPTGLPPGTYNVTVTDAEGCTNTASATVQDAPAIQPSISNVVDVDCNNPVGSVDLTVSGGTPGYTFNWSNGSTAEDPTGLPPGSYTVTVTDANGCTEMQNANIQDNSALPNAVANGNGLITCDEPTLQLNGNGSTTGQGIIYQWTTTNGNIVSGGNTLNPTIDQGGTYTLTVTNTNTGCTQTASISINEDTTPPIATASAGTLTCEVTEITISGAGSSTGPGITYSWSTSNGNIVSGGNSLNPVVDAPGLYTLTVTDSGNGCSATNGVVVPEDITPPLAVAVGDNLTCVTSELTLNGNGSSQGGDFTYLWSTNNGNIISGETTLFPVVDQTGTYTLTVTNESNGCTSAATATVGEDITPPGVDAGPPAQLDCANAFVQLDGSGSTAGPGITYAWNTPNGNILQGGNTTQPIVDAPGTYNLVVTNGNNGCTAEASVMVTEDLTIPFADIAPPETVTCANDEVELNGSNSSSGSEFVYQWSTQGGNITGGTNEAVATANAGGQYTLLVINTNNSCTAELSVIVNENTILPIATAGPPFELDCVTSEVNLIGYGEGTAGNIDILWTTNDGNIVSGETTFSPLVNEDGVYELTITDLDNGCSNTSVTAVTLDDALPIADAGPDQEITCISPQLVLDGSNSSVGADFTYAWSTNDGNILGGETTQFPAVNTAGTYQLVVSNTDNGCSSQSAVVVSENVNYPEVNILAPDSIDCYVPEIVLDASGSTSQGNLDIIWTGSPGNIVSGQGTLTPTVDTGGLYQLTIINLDNGCTTLDGVEVYALIELPTVAAAVPETISCYQPTVLLDASGSDSGPNFEYLWQTNDGGIVEGEDGPTPEVNSGGTYTLTVFNENNNCENSLDVFVPEETQEPVITIFDPDTLNCAIEEINLAAELDSVASFQVNWTTTDGNIVSGEDGLSPLVDASGLYQLEVLNTDNGCSSLADISVQADVVLPEVDPGAEATITCADPVLLLDGSDSDSTISMLFTWTTTNGNIVSGENSLHPQIDAAGTYTLTILNQDNQCEASASVDIDENTVLPLAEAGEDDLLGCFSPTIQLNGQQSSSGPQFAYSWTTTNGNILSGGNSPVPVVDTGGVYELLVTDIINGCTATDSVLVNFNQDLPVVDAGPGGELTCVLTSIQLQGVANGNIDDFVYEWNYVNGNIVNGENTLTPTVNAQGTYELMVTDTFNGCTAIASVVITQDANVPVAVIDAADELNCSVSNISLDGTASSQSPTITYEWTTNNGNFTGGTETLTPSVDQGGTYTLVLVDSANNCVSTTSIDIEPDTIHPLISFLDPGLITCDNPELDLNAQLGGVTGSYGLEWTTNDGNFTGNTNTLTPQIDAPGSYVLSILNEENGCATTAGVEVGQDITFPQVTIDPPEILTCSVTEIDLQASADGGGALLALQWTTQEGTITTGGNSLSPEVTAPGWYQFSVTNQFNGCETIDSVLVPQDIVAPVADAGPSDILNCYQVQLNLNGAGSSQGGDFAYLWTTTNGAINSGETTLSPLIDAPGDYELLVTDLSNGCQSASIVSIPEDFNYPSAVASTPGILTCTQTSLSLEGNTNGLGAGFEYLWTTADGNILGGEESLSPLIDEPGTYEFEVLNAENGCATSSLVTVDENIDYPAIEAGNAETLTCAVQAVTLDGNASASSPDLVYEWTTNNGSIIQDPNTLSPQVTEPGWYLLSILDQNNGCISLDSVWVPQDIEIPLAEASVDDILTCTTTSLNLSGQNSSTGLIFSYAWTTSGGNILSGENSLSPLIDAPGLYQLLVTNMENGCTQTAEVSVDEDIELPITAISEPDILNCVLTETTLDALASSSGNEYDYIWGTTDGNLLSGANSLEPVVDAPGTYELTITNSLTGCSASEIVQVDENIIPPAAEAGTSDLLTCAVTNLELQGSASGNSSDLLYLWSTSNGQLVSGENTLSPLIDAPGTYALLVTDNENGCTATDQVTVEQDVIPPATLLAPPGILNCYQEEILLDATASEQGPDITIDWATFDGNILSGQNSLSPLINQPGTYLLTLTNTVNGCSESAEATVVQDVEHPLVEAGEPFVLPCFEEQYPLQGSVTANTGNLQIQWTTTNGDIASGDESLSPSIRSGGLYTLNILNLENGCSSKDSVEVSENVPGNLTLDGEDPPCFGDLGSIQVTGITGGTPPYLFSIDEGENFFSGQQFSGLEPGFYTMIGQDVNGCETEPVQWFIEQPVEVQLVLEAKAEIKLGDTYQISAQLNLPETEIASIYWTNSETLSCDDCLDPVASPLTTTDYTLEIEDGNGCPATASVRVYVDERPAVYIPNAFSPDGDGVNDVFMIFAKDESVRKVRSFLVFDRWGEKVYEYYNFDPNNPANGWDGMYRGQVLNPQVFGWFAEIEFINGKVILFEGDVTLVR